MTSRTSVSGVLALGFVLACQTGSSSVETRVSGSSPRIQAAPTGYLLPPQEVVDIVDAPRAPDYVLSPDGHRAILAHPYSMPTIEDLAQPLLRLAGTRLNPDRVERQKRTYTSHYRIQDIHTGDLIEVRTPEGARLSNTSWSPDGARFAFLNSTEYGVELWIANAADGKTKRLTTGRVNDVTGSAFSWDAGSNALIVKLVPRGHGRAPEAPQVPDGPIIDETAGESAQNRTYQDLLASPHDEALFEHYFTSQIARIELDGDSTSIGEPGLYADVSPSPDGNYLLVTRIHRPYSYIVPAYSFPHQIAVWTRDGELAHEVADLPLADAVPLGGVPTGPRSVTWQALEDATLFWAEAQDGGDPEREVSHRDALFTHAAPFGGSPRNAGRTVHRYSGISWLDQRSRALVTEYDRDRRWTTTNLVDVSRPQDGGKTVFDRSIRDAYGDPGRPVTRRRLDGTSVVMVEDGWIYLSGAGAGPEGEQPFVDRHDLETGRKERVFHSPLERHTAFVGFAGEPRKGEAEMVLRRQSPTEPPNYFLYEPRRDSYTALTEFPDPHPQLTGIHKEVVTYTRDDGVPLSGTLYLPPGYEAGTRLPMVVWAYPVEYNDAKTAGQIRSTTNRFTRLSSTSPLMFLTQGYAVLDRAAMPVVGDAETMNDTFATQIVGAARAAIDAMAAKGVCDPERVGVGGHSYGAFMTANLLAHCDLFRAGIARSGAYNRSLTPFGFQAERRTLWEAPDVYVAISPFFQADQIDEPILLVHGEVDNNSGTFPVQSKRLFHALKGLGGTARYVRLPHESHGYAARESVLHVLAESFRWFDEHVKGGVEGQ